MHFLKVCLIAGLMLSLQDQLYLAQNIYFEARGDGEEAWSMVTDCVLNRLHSDKYPDTIRGVIWQKGQFSWTSDNISDKPEDKQTWDAIRTFISDRSVIPKTNVTHYHLVGIFPDWADKINKVGVVNSHVVYREL